MMDEVPTKIQPPEGIELSISKVDKKRIGMIKSLCVTGPLLRHSSTYIYTANKEKESCSWFVCLGMK